MTKAFLVGDADVFIEERPPQNSTQQGDFFTWEVNKPSPSQDMVLEDMIGHGHGGHLVQFDDIQQSSPEGTLSEPSAQSDVAYQLEMPSNMYFDGEDGFHDDELALQMNEMSGRAGNEGGLHMVGVDMSVEAGSRDPFGIHGDFGDPYMNGELGFGHGDTF